MGFWFSPLPWVLAVMHIPTLLLSQAITGAGMMAIPRAFLQIGWMPGTLMLVGVAVLTFFTLGVLVQGSEVTHATTYGELALRTCGKGVMRLLQLAVLLFCFGFSVVYLVRVRAVTLFSADTLHLSSQAANATWH